MHIQVSRRGIGQWAVTLRDANYAATARWQNLGHMRITKMTEPKPNGKDPGSSTITSEAKQHINPETPQAGRFRPDQAVRDVGASMRGRKNRALQGTFAMNMALAVLAVATGIIAARILGPSGEGELTAIQTWPLLLGALAMLGLDSALVYFIARQPDKGKQLTSTAILIGLLSSFAVAAVAWFLLPFLLSAQPPQVVSAARVFLLIGGLFAVVGIPARIIARRPGLHCMEPPSHCPRPCLVVHPSCFLASRTSKRHPTISMVSRWSSCMRSSRPHCREAQTTGPVET